MCGIVRSSVSSSSPFEEFVFPSRSQLRKGVHESGWTAGGDAESIQPERSFTRTQPLYSKIPVQHLCPTCQAFIAHVNFEKSQVQGLEAVDGLHRAVERLVESREKGCLFCDLLLQGIREYGETLDPEKYALLGLMWGDIVQCLYTQRKGLTVQVLHRDRRVKLALDFEFDGCEFGKNCAYRVLGPSIELPLQTAAGRSCSFEETTVPPYRTVESRHTLAHTVEMIASWMRNCKIEHPLCREVDLPWIPTRLLDLGTSDRTSDIKLCPNTRPVDRFIALSYCWGLPSGVLKTTKANIAQLKESIPYSALPILFQDAIALTRALGVRYLWIDTFCIIQDDHEDWELQSSAMAAVYSGSYLTIAATASSSPHEGLFVDRWTTSSPSYRPDYVDNNIGDTTIPTNTVTIPLSDGTVTVRPSLHLAHMRFWDVDNSASHLRDAPLMSRAWAFRERLLAPYTLHFHAEELIWECRAGVYCECGLLINSPNKAAELFDKINTGYLKTCFSLAAAGGYGRRVGVEQMGEVWLFLVSEYCQLRLTYESDRLPALSGLAWRLSGDVLGRYVAGVWERDLVRGLLFESTALSGKDGGWVERPEKEANAFTPSRPSWSWASHACLAGQKVTYDSMLRFGFHQSPSLYVEKLNWESGSINTLSWVASSELQVRGEVAELRVRAARNGFWEAEWYEEGEGCGWRWRWRWRRRGFPWAFRRVESYRERGAFRVCFGAAGCG